MNRAKPEAISESPLVGRYFHIWGDDGTVSRQGCVIAQIDPTHYLVQFYEWFTGGASTLHVYTIDNMTIPKADRDERAPGAWQFYEDRAHWNFWFEHNAPRRPRDEAAE
jgi:hypothetical protein